MSLSRFPFDRLAEYVGTWWSGFLLLLSGIVGRFESDVAMQRFKRESAELLRRLGALKMAHLALAMLILVLVMLTLSLGVWRLRVSRYNEFWGLKKSVHFWTSFRTAAQPHYCSACSQLICGFWIFRNTGWECTVCGRSAHMRCLAACDKFDCKCPSQPEPLRHQLVQGNLPSDSVCGVCGIICASPFGLHGLRCLWCGRTVHEECLRHLPEICDLGPFESLLLPPSLVRLSVSSSKLPHSLRSLRSLFRSTQTRGSQGTGAAPDDASRIAELSGSTQKYLTQMGAQLKEGLSQVQIAMATGLFEGLKEVTADVRRINQVVKQEFRRRLRKELHQQQHMENTHHLIQPPFDSPTFSLQSPSPPPLPPTTTTGSSIVLRQEPVRDVQTHEDIQTSPSIVTTVEPSSHPTLSSLSISPDVPDSKDQVLPSGRLVILSSSTAAVQPSEELSQPILRDEGEGEGCKFRESQNSKSSSSGHDPNTIKSRSCHDQVTIRSSSSGPVLVDTDNPRRSPLSHSIQSSHAVYRKLRPRSIVGDACACMSRRGSVSRQRSDPRCSSIIHIESERRRKKFRSSQDYGAFGSHEDEDAHDAHCSYRHSRAIDSSADGLPEGLSSSQPHPSRTIRTTSIPTHRTNRVNNMRQPSSPRSYGIHSSGVTERMNPTTASYSSDPFIDTSILQRHESNVDRNLSLRSRGPTTTDGSHKVFPPTESNPHPTLIRTRWRYRPHRSRRLETVERSEDDEPVSSLVSHHQDRYGDRLFELAKLMPAKADVWEIEVFERFPLVASYSHSRALLSSEGRIGRRPQHRTGKGFAEPTGVSGGFSKHRPLSSRASTAAGNKEMVIPRVLLHRKPLLVFVNVKSGGQVGSQLMKEFYRVLNPMQVVDIQSDGGPQRALQLFKSLAEVDKLRVLVCGGDGTAGWVMEEIRRLYGPPTECHVPVGILPLGTGNDLARVLGWGEAFDGDVDRCLVRLQSAQTRLLDQWSLRVMEQKGKIELLSTSFNNYMDIGIAARISLKFHQLREAHPELFQSRIGNRFLYGEMGVREWVTEKTLDLSKVRLWCDGLPVILSERKIQGLVVLNIPSFSGGVNLWNVDDTDAEGGGVGSSSIHHRRFRYAPLSHHYLPHFLCEGRKRSEGLSSSTSTHQKRDFFSPDLVARLHRRTGLQSEGLTGEEHQKRRTCSHRYQQDGLSCTPPDTLQHLVSSGSSPLISSSSSSLTSSRPLPLHPSSSTTAGRDTRLGYSTSTPPRDSQQDRSSQRGSTTQQHRRLERVTSRSVAAGTTVPAARGDGRAASFISTGGSCDDSLRLRQTRGRDSKAYRRRASRSCRPSLPRAYSSLLSTQLPQAAQSRSMLHHSDDRNLGNSSIVQGDAVTPSEDCFQVLPSHSQRPSLHHRPRTMWDGDEELRRRRSSGSPPPLLVASRSVCPLVSTDVLDKPCAQGSSGEDETDQRPITSGHVHLAQQSSSSSNYQYPSSHRTKTVRGEPLTMGMQPLYAGRKSPLHNEGLFRRWQKQSIRDEMIEVVALRSLFHFGQIQVGLAEPLKVCQGREIRIEVPVEVPIEIDGEPRLLPPHTTIDISYKGKCCVLSPVKSHDDALLVTVNEVLDTAVRDAILTPLQRNCLLWELESRLR